MLRGNRQGDGPGLPRCQGDLLEAFEFLHRPGHGADQIMDVHLDHFLADARARVLDIHEHLGGLAHPNGRSLQPHVAQCERRIAQAEAEGVERMISSNKYPRRADGLWL